MKVSVYETDIINAQSTTQTENGNHACVSARKNAEQRTLLQNKICLEQVLKQSTKEENDV